MNIIETGLKFGSLNYRKSTTRIILHHAAATSCSAEDIHRWHKQKGWAGAGYHFLVRKDGSVYRLRPEAAVGAHASDNNSNSLGICFEGNFETESMTDIQKHAGAELVAYLKNRYGISTVQRHKDVGTTTCPGKNFPFEEISSGQQTSSTPIPAQTASETAPTGFSQDVLDFQRACNADGITDENGNELKEDGLIGTHTRAAAAKVLLKAKLVNGKYKVGSTGILVEFVQFRIGFTGADIDRKYGADTRQGVITYQNNHGLSADGIVGVKTIMCMMGC